MIRERESSIGPMHQQLYQAQMMSSQSPKTNQNSNRLAAGVPFNQMNNSYYSTNNYSSNEMKRQIEGLNRQVFEATKRQESL